MRYSACLIEKNENLDLFPGSDMTNKICEVEFNGIIFHSMTNVWDKQGFYVKTVTFKKVINMFQQMDIAEKIYEGVVEPFKTLTNADANRSGHISKIRGIYTFVKTQTLDGTFCQVQDKICGLPKW